MANTESEVEKVIAADSVPPKNKVKRKFAPIALISPGLVWLLLFFFFPLVTLFKSRYLLNRIDLQLQNLHGNGETIRKLFLNMANNFNGHLSMQESQLLLH